MLPEPEPKVLVHIEQPGTIVAAQTSTPTLSREAKTLRGVAIALICATLLTLPLYGAALLIIGNSIFGVLAIINVFLCVAAFGALQLSKQNRSGAALALLCLELYITIFGSVWIFGVNTSVPFFVMVPILLTALVTNRRTLIITTIPAMAFVYLLYVGQEVLGWWIPLLPRMSTLTSALLNASWVTNVIVLAVILLSVFVTQFERARASLVEASELRAANEQLRQQSILNRQAGSAIRSLALDLATVTRQQAGGTTEQVAAVIEVTTSMEELSETALQIATNTVSVSQAANAALDAATEVKDVTARTVDVSETGRRAVDAAVFGIETVRDKIESLAERLLMLAERSRQISNIVALITSIADETHLLSLNAAIESAGAGENGARFSVIANEVKSLADRSLDATREVRSVIGDVQTAIAAAVLAAEEGKKETIGAVELAYQAGEVIGNMSSVVETASTSALTIVDAVSSVVQLADEIALATRQQQSASDQVVQTLRSIGEVAREVADGSATINQTVSALQNLSAELGMLEATAP